MILAIQDANILIDLHNAGLLEAYFRLGIETHTTDLVLREVSQPVEIFVLRGELKVKTLSGEEMLALVAFMAEQPPSLSLEDCSVLQLAMQMKAILLTGDNKLRNHAIKSKLEAHGVLWLLDLLVEETILDHATAMACLNRLIKTNPRLPVDECAKRQKIWAEGCQITPKRPNAN